ncbi:hypothetical protein KJ596_03400 [Patescibacteria group bacterium]|nr:hypothetical protein [Patescibacteria group bacterium]MBU1867932.1 hypothetical protein [Patescibacteria group bacterium]
MIKRFLATTLIALSLAQCGCVRIPAPHTAQAVSLFETNQTLINEYLVKQQEYQQKVSSYTDLKNAFTTLRDRFQSNQNVVTKSLLLEQVRSYFPATLDAMIAYLEAAKAKIESSSSLPDSQKTTILNEIDQDINYLTQQMTVVENADDLSSARGAAQAIRTYWLGVQVRVKQWTGRLLWAKVNYLLTRLEDTANKLEEDINELKDEGQDVSELEDLLADFREHLSTALEKLELAKEKLEAITNLTEANQLFGTIHQYVKDANQYLRQAHQDLKKLIAELKGYQHRIKRISGTGTLYSQGDGKIALVGNGTIKGAVDSQLGGTVVIADQGGDSQINTNDQGTKETLAENKWRYTAIGTIEITGRDVIAVITGSELDIQAVGTGTVLLQGTGQYKIDQADWQDIPAGGLEASLQ